MSGLRAGRLNQWESGFVISLHGRVKRSDRPLSARQQATLERIVDAVRQADADDGDALLEP